MRVLDGAGQAVAVSDYAVYRFTGNFAGQLSIRVATQTVGDYPQAKVRVHLNSVFIDLSAVTG